MMESDTSDKKLPLEDMPKDDVIKKYNNMLIIAKKAKQSKNGISKGKHEKNTHPESQKLKIQEALEELKKARENESKLTMEVDALKEIIESFTEKQEQFAEVENRIRQSNEKNAELKNSLHKVEGDLKAKANECKQLEEKLQVEGEKLSDMKLKYKENLEKLEDFRENYAKVDIEKKKCQEKLLMYEQSEAEKTNLSKQYSEVLSHRDTLLQTLNDKESEMVNLSEKYTKLEEQFKLVPDNWNTLTSENKRLQKQLQDALSGKDKLSEELEFFRKSLSEFDNKSREYAKLSENLVKEERENLKLMEEINVLKKTNSSKFDDLQEKYNVSQEENQHYKKVLDELRVKHDDDVKALEKTLEDERIKSDREKHEMEMTLRGQVVELESLARQHQENLELVQMEKANLSKLLEELQAESRNREEEESVKCEVCATLEFRVKELEDSLTREKLEKGSLAEHMEKQSRESSALQEEKYEQLKLECQKEAENRLELEKKLKVVQANLEESTKNFMEKLDKQKQQYDSLLADKDKLENLLKCSEENLKKERQDWTERQSEMDKQTQELGSLRTENDNLRAEVGRLTDQHQEMVQSRQETDSDELNKLKGEKEYLTGVIGELEKKCADLEQSNLEKSKVAQESLEREKEAVRALSETNARLESELEEERTKLTNLEGSSRDSLERLTTELAEARERVKDLEGQMTRDESTGHDLREENASLKSEMNLYKESVNLVRRKLDELLSSFTRMKQLRNVFDSEIKTRLKEFEMEQSETRQNIEEVVLRYVGQLHNGNTELLSEMNDMNQVLKERGEAISKLEQLTENQRKELEDARSKLNNQSSKLLEKNRKLGEMEEEVSRAKLEVENKHRAMREMEEEMWRIKNSDGQGDALSSSTISRADDAARMMELEESFEDRYSKLKIIAVKLKKKVAELQKQVEAERNNLLTAESEYQSKVTGFQNQIKSLRNLQSEYDSLQDVLDEEKKEKNSYKKSLESLQQEVVTFKQQLEEAKAEKEKFKGDKNSFEKIKKELTAHISELKQTVEKQKKDKMQLEKELDNIKSQVAVKDRHIEEEREKHKAAILLLEEQKLDSKKHSVLELEMAAYEKTAEELKKKLDSREKAVKELEERMEGERQARAAKEDEMNRLRSSISDERDKVTNIGAQLKHLNDELAGQRNEVQRKVEAIRELEKSLEEKNRKIESLSLEIESVTTEKYKNEEKFRTNEEKFCRQIHTLEDKVTSLQDVLNREEMELKELKNEYQAYKVRAQSVLRQSQGEVNPSKQQNTLEELEQLRSTTESLKTRYEESSKTLQKVVEENGSLQEEKKKLFGRVQELHAVVTDLRNENHDLKESRQKDNEDHVEALRMLKLQSDTLAQCFQREMDDLGLKHAEEVSELKKEVEMLKNRNPIFFKPDIKRADVADKRKISGTFVPVKPEKDVLDVMLLEREECEGSESVDSLSPQGGHHHHHHHSNLIPLEQLLNQSQDLPDARKSAQDVAELQSRLEKNGNRIKHLTVLLAEAESDSARLNQLNDVLKEEIKRLQRSLDREKHAQNFEYLKNVIIKFVSLQSVDEKLRLVPVLNTILKLSPEEETTLTNCAKGIHETGARGWGLSLGIWPTG